MFRALDGWKSLGVVLGFMLATVYTLLTGHDVSALIGSILSALGWADVDLIEHAKVLATVVAPLAIAIWAASSRIWKAVRQFRAGAKPAELLSMTGYLKQARAEGVIP